MDRSDDQERRGPSGFLAKKGGCARATYSRMPADFDKVMLQKYRLTTEKYRRRFRDPRKNRDDTFEEHRERLQQSAGVETVDQFADIVIAKHFPTGLGPAVKQYSQRTVSKCRSRPEELGQCSYSPRPSQFVDYKVKNNNTFKSRGSRFNCGK